MKVGHMRCVVTSTAQVEAELRDALTRIRRAWLAPLSQLGAVRPGTGAAAGWGTPVSLDVIDARVTVATTVCGWARVLIEDRGLEHARIRDVDMPPMCDLLARHAQWLSGHEAADVMCAELRDCAASLERLAPPLRQLSERRPGERVNADRRIALGECALVVVGTWVDERGRGRWTVDLEFRHLGPQCGGRVVAQLDEWSGADATCRSCGTGADVSWWEAHVQPERLVTIRRLREILQVTGVVMTEKALRHLLDRGRLEVAERDALGRRLVDRVDALNVLATRRDRAS